MSAITWAGMWALHEGKKEGKRRAATNSPKGEKFDDAAKRWGGRRGDTQQIRDTENQIQDTKYEIPDIKY